MMRFYNHRGQIINPYDRCELCDDLYKNCPHLRSNCLELAIKSGANVLILGDDDEIPDEWDGNF